MYWFLNYKRMENFPRNTPTETKTLKTERDSQLDLSIGIEEAKRLQIVLDKYKDKRVLVVGPPASGKSTLLQHIPTGVDMDNALFDSMSKREKDFALQRENPYMLIDPDSSGYKRTVKYTQKELDPNDEQSVNDFHLSADFLTTYINSHTKIEVGKPFFATNVIDSDVIVYLKLSDEEYKRRLESRNKTNRPQQLEKAFAIKKDIEKHVAIARNNGVLVEEFDF